VSPEPAPEKPRSRRVLVVLAWITLVLFGAFATVVAVGVALIPRIREARKSGSAPPPAWEARR